MWSWIVSLGTWNWFILAAVLLLLEMFAPGAFMLWLGLSAILVGVDLVRHRLVLADPGHRLCGVRGRADPGLAAVCPQGRAAEPRARSSTAAPTAMSAASSRSTSRSSTASAPSGSTTRSGASPGPIARPAAGSRSRAPTAQTWRWKRRNSRALQTPRGEPQNKKKPRTSRGQVKEETPMIGRRNLADIARPANQKMRRILRMPASVSFAPQSRCVACPRDSLLILRRREARLEGWRQAPSARHPSRRIASRCSSGSQD